MAFNETERLIGDSAKEQLISNPANTIYGKFLLLLILIVTVLKKKLKL